MRRMFRVAAPIILGLAVCYGFSSASSSAVLRDLGAASIRVSHPTQVEEKYRTNFETIQRVVRDRFHDPKLNGVDWERIMEQYRSRLGGVNTKSEFEALVNRMLGELHASHTAYVTD